MNCACIKNDYRFTIDIVDSRYIVYRDISTWMEGFNCLSDTTYEVGIKLPGHVNFKFFEVNNFENVKLDLGDFPDGVYEFTTTSCGVEYTRCEALIPNIQCCLDKLMLSDDKDDKLTILNSELSMFKACVKVGDLENAKELFNIVKQRLKNLNCNCNCI